MKYILIISLFLLPGCCDDSYDTIPTHTYSIPYTVAALHVGNLCRQRRSYCPPVVYKPCVPCAKPCVVRPCIKRCIRPCAKSCRPCPRTRCISHHSHHGHH